MPTLILCFLASFPPSCLSLICTSDPISEDADPVTLHLPIYTSVAGKLRPVLWRGSAHVAWKVQDISTSGNQRTHPEFQSSVFAAHAFPPHSGRSAVSKIKVQPNPPILAVGTKRMARRGTGTEPGAHWGLNPGSQAYKASSTIPTPFRCC